MLRLVDRYLFVETAKVFSAIIATLLLVMISMLLLRTLEQVNVGALQSDAVLRFLGYQVLRDLASLLPPAFFIAALVTLGRLARDSELIAFSACGIGPWRLYRSLLLLALPLSLATAWFSLIVQPYASAQIQRIEDARGSRATQVSGLQAGRFYQQDAGRITFYAGSVGEDRQFHDIFIQDRSQEPPRLVLSERGSYRENGASERREIVLEAGWRFDGHPGTAAFSLAEFDRYTFFLAPEQGAGFGRRRRSNTPTAALLGSEQLADRAELGHRLAGPVGIYILGLLAIPLTALSPRQRGTGRAFLAFLAYFAFFNLQRLAQNWFETGITPPWLGMLWYQVVIVILVYIVLFWNSFWLRWMLQGRPRMHPQPKPSA
jgi:lipopolysaccharide export system permease protein